MAIRHPRHRRWIVRRLRFQDNKGGQVTDTWLNVPLLPRRILSWRSQDRRWGHVQWSIRMSPFTDLVILIGVVAIGIYQKASTGQWLSAILGCLIMVAAFLVLAQRWRGDSQRPR